MYKRSFLGGSSRLGLIILTGVIATGLAGCASMPDDPIERAEFEQERDPLEPFNRAVFSFNNQIDGMFLRPAATLYREVLPNPVQTGVNNFLTNLRAPVVFINDVLQGQPDRAGTTAGRFLVNSTLGVLGVLDVASDIGLPAHSADFGQTFGVWGVGEGFYLVLPIFGPSNPRDATGLVTEYFLDPVNIVARNNDWEEWLWVRGLATGVDFRSRNIETLDEIERVSLDYYVAIRSLYRQRRAEAIRQGGVPSDHLVPGLSLREDPEPGGARAASAH